MQTESKIMGVYKNDPRDDYETIREYTPIDIFWQTEGDVPEYVEQAIVYLERENKRLRDEIKTLKQPKVTLDKNDIFNLTSPKL